MGRGWQNHLGVGFNDSDGGFDCGYILWNRCFD